RWTPTSWAARAWRAPRTSTRRERSGAPSGARSGAHPSRRPVARASSFSEIARSTKLTRRRFAVVRHAVFASLALAFTALLGPRPAHAQAPLVSGLGGNAGF